MRRLFIGDPEKERPRQALDKAFDAARKKRISRLISLKLRLFGVGVCC